MEDCRYSWLVQVPNAKPKTAWQVNADTATVTPSGDLVFSVTRKDGSKCVLHAMAKGTWLRFTIMSQLSGYQNGYEVVGPD